MLCLRPKWRRTLLVLCAVGVVLLVAGFISSVRMFAVGGLLGCLLAAGWERESGLGSG